MQGRQCLWRTHTRPNRLSFSSSNCQRSSLKNARQYVRASNCLRERPSDWQFHHNKGRTQLRAYDAASSTGAPGRMCLQRGVMVTSKPSFLNHQSAQRRLEAYWNSPGFSANLLLSSPGALGVMVSPHISFALSSKRQSTSLHYRYLDET